MEKFIVINDTKDSTNDNEIQKTQPTIEAHRKENSDFISNPMAESLWLR